MFRDPEQDWAVDNRKCMDGTSCVVYFHMQLIKTKCLWWQMIQIFLIIISQYQSPINHLELCYLCDTKITLPHLSLTGRLWLKAGDERVPVTICHVIQVCGRKSERPQQQKWEQKAFSKCAKLSSFHVSSLSPGFTGSFCFLLPVCQAAFTPELHDPNFLLIHFLTDSRDQLFWESVHLPEGKL